MGEKWKIAAGQFDAQLANRGANLQRMEEYVDRAASQGARLIAFPECALSGYCFTSREEAWPHAETIPGESTTRMQGQCKKHDVFVLFGLLERQGSRLFNACVILGKQGVVGVYRKIHLPYLGIDMFADYGDLPFRVWDLDGLKVGMHICYDGSFPESARCMALAGADLIVLPTNWPPGSECASECLPRTRAMENHVYFMSVNRVGEERGFRFIGKSKACDPYGHVLFDATADQEELLLAEIEPDKARQKEVVRVKDKHLINRIGDRRPKMYGPLVEPVSSSMQTCRREPPLSV